MKLFGYIRVSGKGQKDQDGPARQKDAIAKFSASHDVEIQHIFSDIGVSGTIDGLDRPELVKLIASCELGQAEGIVVESMERFARDLIVSEVLIAELKKRNIKLFAADVGFHDQVTADADPSRKLIRQILAAVAEHAKSTLVLKLRAARERVRQQKGHCEGGKGYRDTNAGRIIVNLIISLRDSGCGWWTVASLLNRDKVKKANGSPWTYQDVRKIYLKAVLKEKKQ
jgi:DNA invertase Pin-like site-specific DNA recombinase